MNHLKCGIILLITFILFSCDSGSNSPVTPPPDATTSKGDSVWFSQVTPHTPIIDGQSTLFTITLGYKLVSQNEAVIGIGFNDGKMHSRLLVKRSLLVEEKGEGFRKFEITSTVKDWGSQSPFVIFANMSLEGNDLAFQMETLIPQK